MLFQPKPVNLTVRITHHKPFLKICVIPTADSNSHMLLALHNIHNVSLEGINEVNNAFLLCMNFGTVVGENPTPYGILALRAVNGLSIVCWDAYVFLGSLNSAQSLGLRP